MFRKKKIIVFALITLIIFVITTNYLFLSVNKSTAVFQENDVKYKIYKELENLPESYKFRNPDVDNLTEVFIHNVKTYSKSRMEDLENVWNLANFKVSKKQLYDASDLNLVKVIYALKNAPIIKADLDGRGTQLKLLLTLEGNQLAIFKPKWYNRDHIIEGPVYAGKDRYGAEIVAFYLSIILNKPLTPISTPRIISLKHDIMPVATKQLKETSFLKNNKTCIYGKCYYCKKEDAICENDAFLLTGAVIFNVKSVFKSFKSPWQRTYKKGKLASWEKDKNYCSYLKQKVSKTQILEFVDVAIFDFLIQNGDRHHYEAFGNNILLLDNGKALGNPYVQHIDILAPLYQCCILKRDTWRKLQSLSGGRLKEKLKKMPEISNVVTDKHLDAIEQRLLIIFATVEYCRHLNK